MHAALKDIRSTLQHSKSLPQPLSQQQQQQQQQSAPLIRDDDLNHMISDRNASNSPIWLPRHHHNQHSQSHESLNSDNPSKPLSLDDDEADTDLETDRLLGQQRLDDHGFYDEKVIIFQQQRNTKFKFHFHSLTMSVTTSCAQTLNWCDRTSRLIKSPSTSMAASKASQSQQQHHSQTFSSATIRQGIGTSTTGAAAAIAGATGLNITSSPPALSGIQQQIPKTNITASDQNDVTENSCLTSPNKLIMPTVQKSPSESLSSKTDTDGKKCSGKARNKEGTIRISPSPKCRHRHSCIYLFHLSIINYYDS